MDHKTELPPPDYQSAAPHTPKPPSSYSGNGTWDPRASPVGTPLGTYAPTNIQPGPHAGMMPSQVVMVQQFPTANFCPGTGGAHIPHTRAGAMGIIIGIVFCPIGLIAIPFDKKVQCDNCKYVIKESWGSC